MRSRMTGVCRPSTVGLLAAGLLLTSSLGAVAQDAATLDPNADLATQSLVISNWAAYMPDDLPANFQGEFGHGHVSRDQRGGHGQAHRGR